MKKTHIALAFAGALLATGIAASANAATGTGSFTATCDPANYGFSTNGVAYQHSTKGTLSIKQTDTDPELTSSVKAVSQNGNSLSVKNVSDGETASFGPMCCRASTRFTHAVLRR